MIRVTAPLPAEFDAQVLADQVGALAVNVIEPDLLAAYWDDDDPQALTAESWAEVVAAHVPVADGPPSDPLGRLLADLAVAQTLDEVREAAANAAAAAG